MIEIYFKTVRDGEFKRIFEVRAGSWLSVKETTTQDLEKIVELTGLEMADLRDSLDKQELPRIEMHGELLLVFIRHPTEQERGLYTATLTLILTPLFLITISPERSEIIEHLLMGSPLLGTTQKSKLLLHILLKMTQDFTTSIKKVRSTILEQEQSATKVDDRAIVVLTKNEEILNQYLTALVPMRNVLENIATGRYLNLYETDFDLLHDLMNAIKQSEDLCRVNVKSIRSLRDSYQIFFTNDVNRTIKLLTALMIIFTIPMIIASFYGMNMSLPFQASPYAFLWVLVISLVAAVGAVLFFVRKRWL